MTRETETAFKILYCEYKRRRSYGTSKAEAMRFEQAKLQKIDAYSEWNPEDLRYALHELRKIKAVRIDILGNVELTESGIEYMEDKPIQYFETVSKFFNLLAIFI